jgi:lipopolysaccharide export system protein LptA
MDRGTHVLAVLLVVLCVFAVSAEAAGEAKKKTKGKFFEAGKKEAIIITSDRMELDRKKNTISYKGKVVAVRGDATMRSETLTATYDSGMVRLKKVIAEGKVRVTQGGRVATSVKAVFNSQDNTISLVGNPSVRQGKNQISGSRIILFINEDRVVVEGGARRVEAVIFPDDLGK